MMNDPQLCNRFKYILLLMEVSFYSFYSKIIFHSYYFQFQQLFQLLSNYFNLIRETTLVTQLYSTSGFPFSLCNRYCICANQFHGCEDSKVQLINIFYAPINQVYCLYCFKFLNKFEFYRNSFKKTQFLQILVQKSKGFLIFKLVQLYRVNGEMINYKIMKVIMKIQSESQYTLMML